MGIFSVSTMIILKRKRGSLSKCDPGILAEHIGNMLRFIWASLNYKPVQFLHRLDFYLHSDSVLTSTLFHKT